MLAGKPFGELSSTTNPVPAVSHMSKVVVISGLAEGMGRRVAELLADSGWTICGFDMNPEGIAELSAALEERGTAHLLSAIDICDRGAVTDFKDAVLDQFGAADAVLSNVGIGFFGPFEEVDLQRAMKCLEINVIGAASLIQAFIPSMRARRSGKLIVMSSLVGQVPFPFESIYCASKFALEGLVLSARYEVEPFGIQTAIIQPAQVSTAFAAKIHVLPPEGSPYRERVKRFIERDRELIKTAPTPQQAAKRIVAVVEAEKPKLFNRLDAKSNLFLWLNSFLPRRLRDAVLLRQMDIRV